MNTSDALNKAADLIEQRGGVTRRGWDVIATLRASAVIEAARENADAREQVSA